MPASLLKTLTPPLFVLIWATGFIVARLVAPFADPITFLSLRFALAAMVLAILALVVRAPWPGSAREWRNGLIAGALLHGIYLSGVFWAVKHGLPAGIAALVAGLQPLATGALVGPLLGERVSSQRWLGIAIGCLGAGLVIAPKLGAADGFPPLPLVVCIVGMLAITFGTIWQKRTAMSADLRTNAVVQYLGALVVTVPLMLVLEEMRLDFTASLWIGLVWAVLGLSIGAIGLLLVLIRRGEVAGVAALLYLVPPVSALMAFALFGETLSFVQIAGMLVATLGVAVASRG